jgi:7 transmembrane receptor (rhodopsin family)
VQLEARKKVARIVLSFVVVFIICWLPRHVWYFWYHFDEYGEYNMFWHIFKIAAFCLSFINSCVNPFALYFLSRQFRHYYHRYLCRLCLPHCSPPLDGGSTSLAGGGDRDGPSHGRAGGRQMPGGAETCQLMTLNSAPRSKKQPNASVTMVTTLA